MITRIILLLLLCGLTVSSQTLDKITFPKASDTLIKDSTYSIIWEYNAISKTLLPKVKIELISDSTYLIIADSTNMNNGYSFKFSVDTGQYYLRITAIGNISDSIKSEKFNITFSKIPETTTKDSQKEFPIGKSINWLILNYKSNKSNFSDDASLLLSMYDTLFLLENKLKDNNSELALKQKRYIRKIKEDLDVIIKKSTMSPSNDFPLKISIIGDAALVGTTNDSKQDKFNTKGSLGFKFTTNLFRKIAVHGKVSLVLLSNTDTIKSKNLTVVNSTDTTNSVTNSQDFGNSILNPRSGESIQSGMVELDFFIKEWWGISTSIVLGTKVWKDSINENQISTENARILGLSAGVFWAPSNRQTKENNDIGLKLYMNISNRFLLGDAKINSKIRSRLLESDKWQFWGIEPGFVIDYRSITAFVSCPIFFGTTVKGVTSGQFLGGISISTSIVDFEPDK